MWHIQFGYLLKHCFPITVGIILIVTTHYHSHDHFFRLIQGTLVFPLQPIYQSIPNWPQGLLLESPEESGLQRKWASLTSFWSSLNFLVGMVKEKRYTPTILFFETSIFLSHLGKCNSIIGKGGVDSPDSILKLICHFNSWVIESKPLTFFLSPGGLW